MASGESTDFWFGTLEFQGGDYAKHVLAIVVRPYLLTFSSVVRHMRSLHDKFEVDKRLK